MPTLPRDLPGLVLRRLLAAGSAALVLALAVFAVSPNAHAWIHDDEGHAEASGHAEHGCAVELFAGGVPPPLQPEFLTQPREAIFATAPRDPEELFLAPARYLRLPERGPPGC